MDFNYLYHRQQVSLMRADAAACESSRAAHQGLARLYGSLIDRKRAGRTGGAAASERGSR
ncbi:hypothetical protein E2493_20400 [Sphingomonas parva]|uniref:Uncharacterized protein n=1 Tax=Sphingomonas parva TaxID=2555898 RepID=A0A4Y8ZNL6_9SPHN|nr:hypothetical protein [Sphingomonas parva]TFI56399.1 hypothetical protein E2493_20400 [Sphingomonas parva]